MTSVTAAATGFAAASPSRSPKITSRHHCNRISRHCFSCKVAHAMNFGVECIKREQCFALVGWSEQSREITVAIVFAQVIGAICERLFHFANPARGSGHCNETRSDTSVLRQENVVGPHRGARRHRINGKRQFAKFLMQFLRHGARISARTNEKEIKAIRAIKGSLQDSLVQFSHIYDRPRPDAIRETEQRATMRHAAKSKSTFTVGFY